MADVPSMRRIAKNFTRDVTLKTWRGRRHSDSPVEFTGARKDLFDHLMSLAADCEKRRAEVIAGLNSREDILKRGREARRVFRRVMGLAKLPERTPLRPRVTPGWEREAYRVENVIFESRPGYFVTANLYLPKTGKPPFPTVLGVSGHTQTGKHPYQDIAVPLATSGLAVLMTDPAGQGERDEYVDLATGKRTVTRACRSHALAGDPAYLVGWNLGGYRLWDCMRAIDYIASRPDLDSSRIGVTGTSGGGWESLWLAAVDTRVKAVNSNCYLTTWRRRMEDRYRDAEPDPEQDPFGVMSAGLDAADLIIACFPRAASFGVAIFDFFPVDGALACYMEAKRLYKMAGVADRLGICVGDIGHGRTLEMRRQTAEWMLRWLADVENPRVPDEIAMHKAEVPDEETWCTSTGIVLTSLGGRTTAQITGERARALALTRKTPKNVARTLGKLLAYEPVDAPMDVECGRAVKVAKATVTPMRIRSDGDIQLTAHLWKPTAEGRRPAVITLEEKSKKDDPLRNPLARKLASAGAIVLDLDPRGMGPADEVWLDQVPLLETNLTADGFLLGRPVSGMRVADVIRAVELLAERDDVDVDRISVVGEGYGALLALLSACIDQRIARVVERRALSSWASLTWHREYDWPVSFIVPGVLEHFDLDDLRASLAPRPRLSIEPLDHMKRALKHRPKDEKSVIARFVTSR